MFMRDRKSGSNIRGAFKLMAAVAVIGALASLTLMLSYAVRWRWH